LGRAGRKVDEAQLGEIYRYGNSWMRLWRASGAGRQRTESAGWSTVHEEESTERRCGPDAAACGLDGPLVCAGEVCMARRILNGLR